MSMSWKDYYTLLDGNTPKNYGKHILDVMDLILKMMIKSCLNNEGGWIQGKLMDECDQNTMCKILKELIKANFKILFPLPD